MSIDEHITFDWDEGDHYMPYLELKLDPEALRLYWTTNTGNQIYIEDMETRHIQNLIKADMNEKLRLTERTADRFLLELSIRKAR